MQYKGVEVKCTQEELDSFKAGISVSYTIHDFSETYNGHEIENQTGQPDAKYYLLTVRGSTYLQPHDPNQPGFVPITAENVDIIARGHADIIIDNIVFTTYGKTQQDIIDGLTTENSDLRSRMGDVELALADLFTA